MSRTASTFGTATARHLIAAVGCLSASRIPDLPGIDTFAGEIYHTGRWQHEGVDFTGKRVAVIGTGSSGIQAIPPIDLQPGERHADRCPETPIQGLTPRGVIVGEEELEFDAIVFATGFDAMTGALNAIDIRGAGGLALKAEWSAGPRTYLGIGSAGFPNLFMINGPGSPSVPTNMIVSIEQHVDWITDLISFARSKQLARVAVDRAAQDSWVDHVNEVAAGTLYPEAASWYLGANIPGKPRVFMPYLGGVGGYREICDAVADSNYRGFVLTALTDKHKVA